MQTIWEVHPPSTLSAQMFQPNSLCRDFLIRNLSRVFWAGYVTLARYALSFREFIWTQWGSKMPKSFLAKLHLRVSGLLKRTYPSLLLVIETHQCFLKCTLPTQSLSLSSPTVRFTLRMVCGSMRRPGSCNDLQPFPISHVPTQDQRVHFGNDCLKQWSKHSFSQWQKYVIQAHLYH